MGGDTQKIYYLNVKGVAPKIKTSKLPDGSVGSAYSAAIEAIGSAPLKWSAEGLPSGLTMSNGTISGTPTTAGKFKVKVTLSNNTKSAKKSYTLKIAAAENVSSSRDTTQRKTHNVIAVNDDLLNNGGQLVNDDYVVVAELGAVSVDEAGMYEFSVKLSDDVMTGKVLVWLANSSEPCDDDGIAEFYASDGEETSHVPDDRIITVSAWLNPERIYTPSIAILQ